MILSAKHEDTTIYSGVSSHICDCILNKNNKYSVKNRRRPKSWKDLKENGDNFVKMLKNGGSILMPYYSKFERKMLNKKDRQKNIKVIKDELNNYY